MIVNLLDECLTNYIMIQKIWHHHWEFREEKELRKVGVKNHCNQHLHLVFREKRRRKSGRQKLSSVHVAHHATCIWTCTQSGMTIPSHLSSEMHLGKFPDHTEFQSWIANFRTEVCSKAKNPTRALQWIKEIETAKSLDDLSLQNQQQAKISLITKNWI